VRLAISWKVGMPRLTVWPGGPGRRVGTAFLGADEADAQALGFAQPALAFSLGDAGGQLSRISSSRGR